MLISHLILENILKTNWVQLTSKTTSLAKSLHHLKTTFAIPGMKNPECTWLLRGKLFFFQARTRYKEEHCDTNTFYGSKLFFTLFKTSQIDLSVIRNLSKKSSQHLKVLDVTIYFITLYHPTIQFKMFFSLEDNLPFQLQNTVRGKKAYNDHKLTRA